jgi:hypothetical protein
MENENKQVRTGLRRRVAAVAAGVAGLMLAAGAQAPAFADGGGTGTGTGTGTPPDPAAVSYRDCPTQLPAGVDRSQWRCEVTIAYGRMTIGGLDLPDIAPITLVHAEGPLADGSGDWGQEFGSLRAEPTPVAGGLTGDARAAARVPALRLSVQPEYGGYADFLGTGTDRGGLAMNLRLVSPLLPHGCTIGTDASPVTLHLERSGDSTWLSQNPPLVEFDAHDSTFTAPAATDCGPLGPALNKRLRLPSATGANSLSYTAYYTFKTYDQLPAA